MLKVGLGQTELNWMLQERKKQQHARTSSHLLFSAQAQAEEGAGRRGQSPCRELIPGSDGRVGFTSLETRKWGRALVFTEHLPSQALCWTVYMSFSRQKSMGR